MIINLIELLDAGGRLAYNAAADRLHRRRAKKQRVGQDTPQSGDTGTAVHIGDLLPSRHGPSIREAVWLRFKTRLRHVFITGQVGSGKTNLALLLLLADVRNGLFCIDYRGEFFDLILQYLAQYYTWEELKDRLVLFDIRQLSAFGKSDEWVVVFNLLLELGDPYAAIAFLKDLLTQVWGSAMGVQILDDFQHIGLALTLSPAGPFSLLDVDRFLTEPDFRAHVVAGIEDPMVLRYVARLETVKDLESRAQALSNKLSPLLASNLRLRATLGNTKKAYSFRSHFERVKNPIVLICLAADEVGDKVAGIVGALFLSAGIKAVMRSDRAVTEEPTHGVHFLLDEAANYAAGIEEPLGRLIREGRKFGAFATLITQTPSSLPVSVRNVLIDVCGTMCFFAQGPQQADTVAGWVQSDETPRPVVRQFLMQAKPGEALLLRQGHTPRRMQTLLAPYPTVGEAKVRALRKAALEHWGIPSQTETVTLSQSPAESQGDIGNTPVDSTATTEAPCTPLEAREVDEARRPKRSRRGAAR